MLGLDLPSVGIFDIPSTSRAGQTAAVGRLLSFARETDSIAFSGRTVLLNAGCSQPYCRAVGELVDELAAAMVRRGANVILQESTQVKGGPGRRRTGSWRRVCLSSRKTRQVKLYSRTYRLPNMLFEVDMVVNVAGLFREPRAILAGAIYNMSELLCGRNRRRCLIRSLDSISFNATIVDLISKVVPDLNILIVPDPVQRGAQLLVSTDAVAVDSLAAGLAGHDPQEIPAVRLAAESGLGIGWLEAIRLFGDRPRPWKDLSEVRPESNPPESSLSRITEPVSGEAHLWRLLAGDAGGVRPVSVTYCPGANYGSTLTSVATCVGEARCEGCQECVGDCPVLPS